MTALPASRFVQRACSFTLVAFALIGCSSETTDDGGSSEASGGTPGVGGAGVGGSTGGTGVPGTGGTGGTPAVGGSVGAGGLTGDTGGAAAGGLTGTGGSLGAGGSGTGASSSGGASTGGSGGSSGAFTLSSPDLAEGSTFGDKYTCTAAGFQGSLSPELVWTAGPPGTKSYAITLIDTTLTQGQPPSDLGYHWVIYNIPANVLSLPEEFKNASSIGASQNNNYLGPCPNYGGGTAEHTYEFTIYALDTETFSLTATSGTNAAKEAEGKLEASNLASAKLTGKSKATTPLP